MPSHAPVYSTAAGSLGASLADFGPDLAFGVFLAFLAGGSAAASSSAAAGASAATGSASAAGSSAAGASATACKGRGVLLRRPVLSMRRERHRHACKET